MRRSRRAAVLNSRTALLPLPYALEGQAAAGYTAGAIFGGGGYWAEGEYHPYAGAILYAERFMRTVLTELSVARYDLAAAAEGGLILFGGGTGSGIAVSMPTTDAYDANHNRSSPASLSVERSELAGGDIGTKLLFAGGVTISMPSGYAYTFRSTVDAYDESLNRTTPTSLGVARAMLATVKVGNYRLFAGGSTTIVAPTTKSTRVDAYNEALTRTTPTALSVARANLAGANAGAYAFFGGGDDGSGAPSDVIDVYDAELTRTVLATPLLQARMDLTAGAAGGYVLFGGGRTTFDGEAVNTVDAYAADSLTRVPARNLRYSRAGAAVAPLSDPESVIFGGGGRQSVEVYTRTLRHFVSAEA